MGDQRFYKSPVVLCSSTWKAFGGKLHARLMAECQKSGQRQPVSHLGVDTFWHPHSVQAIADAFIARTALMPKP